MSRLLECALLLCALGASRAARDSNFDMLREMELESDEDSRAQAQIVDKQFAGGSRSRHDCGLIAERLEEAIKGPIGKTMDTEYLPLKGSGYHVPSNAMYHAVLKQNGAFREDLAETKPFFKAELVGAILDEEPINKSEFTDCQLDSPLPVAEYNVEHLAYYQGGATASFVADDVGYLVTEYTPPFPRWPWTRSGFFMQITAFNGDKFVIQRINDYKLTGELSQGSKDRGVGWKIYDGSETGAVMIEGVMFDAVLELYSPRGSSRNSPERSLKGIISKEKRSVRGGSAHNLWEGVQTPTRRELLKHRYHSYHGRRPPTDVLKNMHDPRRLQELQRRYHILGYDGANMVVLISLAYAMAVYDDRH